MREVSIGTFLFIKKGALLYNHSYRGVYGLFNIIGEQINDEVIIVVSVFPQDAMVFNSFRLICVSMSTSKIIFVKSAKMLLSL